MDWYNRASEGEIRSKVKGLFEEVYGGIPEVFEKTRWPNLTEEELIQVEQSLLSEKERKRIKQTEEKRRLEEEQIVLEHVPPEIYNLFEIEPVHESDVLTRYVWGNSEEIQAVIQQGLEMNEGHSALPPGWYYLHVGGEEWVAILSRDYGRDGDVCELEISELPEGFFLIEDTDIMDRTSTPYSRLLISKMAVVPPNCIAIAKVFDTEDIVEQYPDNYDH